MIVLNLICEHQHRFEGWFASNDEFSRQHSRDEVSCPSCGSARITRLPVAPRIRRQGSEAECSTAAPPEVALASAFRRLIVESEDVGERFPEEARKIHYAEVSPRRIRGRSTSEEALELLKEGIPVLPLPLPYGSDTH
jgi:hypothetical protein